jgi:hypothetical protein
MRITRGVEAVHDGGVPHYLLRFNPQRSLAWNITHNALHHGEVLYLPRARSRRFGEGSGLYPARVSASGSDSSSHSVTD